MNLAGSLNIYMELLENAQHVLSTLECRLLKHMIQSLACQMSKIDGDISYQLTSLISDHAEWRTAMVQNYRAMEKDLGQLTDSNSQVERMLLFLSTFTDPDKLKGDRKAFRRWMDAAAVRERARCELHERERSIEIAIKYLRFYWGHSNQKQNITQISELLWEEFNESPRWQNRMAVLAFWIDRIRSGDERATEIVSKGRWYQKVREIVEQGIEEVWLQLEAFRLLTHIDSDETYNIITKRFEHPLSYRTDLFVRSGLLNILRTLYTPNQIEKVLKIIFFQPDLSDHLQIHAADAIINLSDSHFEYYANQVLNDTESHYSDRVKAQTARSISTFVIKKMGSKLENENDFIVLKNLLQNLNPKQGILTARSILEGIGEISATYGKLHRPDSITEFDHNILRSIDRVISNQNFHEKTRRFASVLREQVILSRDAEARRLRDLLENPLSQIVEGEKYRIPRHEIRDEKLFGRVLASLCAFDFGFSVVEQTSGYDLYKGDHYRRKVWRILDALMHPDPSKRQGFLHTVGRHMPGTMRVNSRILAEMTETKVPGERLYVSEEASWRPYLPTVDDLLSLTSNKLAGRIVRLFSAEGILELQGPQKLSDRYILWLHLTLEYRDLMQRRNLEASRLDAAMTRSFIQVVIEDLGVSVKFTPNT
ncbi:hypothetical protein JW979_03895, partial [bacterium]|nr:hypothetical protein [candidate division CSSED10-310 bacterium]